MYFHVKISHSALYIWGMYINCEKDYGTNTLLICSDTQNAKKMFLTRTEIRFAWCTSVRRFKCMYLKDNAAYSKIFVIRFLLLLSSNLSGIVWEQGSQKKSLLRSSFTIFLNSICRLFYVDLFTAHVNFFKNNKVYHWMHEIFQELRSVKMWFF